MLVFFIAFVNKADVNWQQTVMRATKTMDPWTDRGRHLFDFCSNFYLTFLFLDLFWCCVTRKRFHVVVQSDLIDAFTLQKVANPRLFLCQGHSVVVYGGFLSFVTWYIIVDHTARGQWLRVRGLKFGFQRACNDRCCDVIKTTLKICNRVAILIQVR